MSSRLDSFSAPRAPRSGAHGGGYTFFVRLAKIALPLAALVIIGVVIARLSQPPLQRVEVVTPAHRKTQDKAVKPSDTAENKAPSSPVSAAVPGQVEVVKAQYEGVDEKGRPYTLIADKAARAEGSDDTALLDGVKADITLEDKSWIAVHADHGSYAAKAQQLSLSGNVAIFHDSGYEMHLEQLDLDLKSRHALSPRPVHAQGPMGEIAGQSLEVTQGGDLVVFGGPAKLTFNHLGRQG